MILVQHLSALESAGLLRLAQMAPELEYLFRHALIQDAAYASLVKQDRQRLHLAVGEALERSYPDRLTSRDLAPLLAQHFDAAGDETRALRYFTLAGDAAARVYANAEAGHHYSRAVALARRAAHVDGQTLHHLFFSLGRALELSAQDARALDTYADAERVARERDDHAMELAAMIARATIYLKPVSVRDPDKGRSLSEHTLALARELGDRESETKSLWNLMQFYKWTGQMAEALAHGEQALAIARQRDVGRLSIAANREHLAYVLHDIASIYASTGQIQRALAAMDEAQQLWRELGVLNMLADCLSTTAEFHVLCGEYERAFALSGEALHISRAIGNLWNESYSWYLIDLAHMDRGEMGRAIEAAEESLRLAKQAGFVPGLVQAILDLTWIYTSLGAVHRGYEVAERIRDIGEETSLMGPFDRVMAARLHMLSGRLLEAREALDEARRGYGVAKIPSFAIFYMNLVEAEWALSSGDYALALDVADETVSLLRQAGLRLGLSDVLYFKGRALLGLDRAEEAYAALNEARAEAEAIGSRRTLWRILLAVSEIESRRGRHAEAQSRRRQAREIVEFIADHTGSPELRESFLNLRDVRDVMGEA
ncbi:MAG TPA: hypothetical protein VFL17_03160 [Anaerolineae bacterium]|nr:hypothetical protein [Anaerolineae bacterium]